MPTTTLLDDHATDPVGTLLRPDDPGYADAVTTMTGTGTPDLVARPRTTAEVVEAVRTAARAGLPLTVRSGGHSIAGLSTPATGMLLDLRGLDGIAVDPATRVVQVGAGATWGAVARALTPHGLGLTAGDTASVGVGGLLLGGGIGWMVRLHGLAIDHLVGAEVVTADGRVLEVSADREPDLFWALRGGGGGLGVVVTRADLHAQRVGDVVFGELVLALEDPAAVLTGWRDVQLPADERLTTTLSLVPAAPDRPAVAMIGACFAGPEPDAAEPLAALRGLGHVLQDTVTVRPYADVLAEAHHGAGMRLTMRNALLPRLDDDVLADVAALAAPPTVLNVRALGGAFSRVAADATAFAHRDAVAMVSALRMPTAPGQPAPAQLPGWDAVARHGTGSYLNFDSGYADRHHPDATRERLARVRDAVDPDGRLRHGPVDR